MARGRSDIAYQQHQRGLGGVHWRQVEGGLTRVLGGSTHPRQQQGSAGNGFHARFRFSGAAVPTTTSCKSTPRRGRWSGSARCPGW